MKSINYIILYIIRKKNYQIKHFSTVLSMDSKTLRTPQKKYMYNKTRINYYNKIVF